MNRSIPIGAALSVAACLFTTAALADVAPPPGFEEPCSVEKQQLQDEVCQLCDGAWHGDPDKCAKDLSETAFAQRCRTNGASTWSEVWCRKLSAQEQAQQPPPPPPPQEQPPQEQPQEQPPPPAVRQSGCGGGCAVGAPLAGAGGAGGALALFWLSLAARRRKRSRPDT